MAFLSPTPSIMSGLDPRAQQLIQDARNMGLGEDEIAQMLDSSGFNPMEYANDLYAPSTPLPSKEPGSTIPPQVAQTLGSLPGMEPTFTPPAPPTLNKARIGTGDKSYGDYNDPNVFTQRWNDAADSYGVPRDIAQGLLTTENAARDPFAVNPTPGSTAMGLGQLTDAAQADYNKAHGTNFSREDFFDPDLNTDATFWYWTTRNGDTLFDKTRAYNAGNTGAARGEGGDYANSVMAKAGLPGGGGGGRGPATGMDGTSTLAAPPAYNDLPNGMITPGNVDLTRRPYVRNDDGSTSTVRSMSFEENGREVLVPTVVSDPVARVLSDDEAIDYYHRTGQHLGVFDTPENATAYADQVHRDQEGNPPVAVSQNLEPPGGGSPVGDEMAPPTEPGLMDSLGTTIFGEKDKPNFFGKLMGVLGGPLGEGLMGMGAGILGARGTYGNTFQAIGQGGEKGLQAYGYAQRRAQRDKEAAAQAKLEQQKLASQAEDRKFTRTNMKMQTLSALSKTYGGKAVVKYLRANPDLLAQFGGDVDESTFEDKDGWKTTVSNGYVIRTNDRTGASELQKLPEDLKVAHYEEIEENGKRYKVGLDERGKRVVTLPAPSKDNDGKSTIVEARPPDDLESGITIQYERKPDGTMTPLRDENGNYRYGAQGNKPFRPNPVTGKPELAPKERGRSAAGETKLDEARDSWNYSLPLVKKMLGNRDAKGDWDYKGILDDKTLGAFASLAKAKAGEEAQWPLVEKFISGIWRQRPTMASGGADVAEKDKYTEKRWFDPNISRAEYAMNALAFQLALTNNPDGRISDQDIKIARDMLGGSNPLSFATDARQKLASFFETTENKAVRTYVNRGEEDQIPEELRPAYMKIIPGSLEPKQRERWAKKMQEWGVPEPGSAAATPPPDDAKLTPPKPGLVLLKKDETMLWQTPEKAKELVEQHGWSPMPGGGYK